MYYLKSNISKRTLQTLQFFLYNYIFLQTFSLVYILKFESNYQLNKNITMFPVLF